MAELGRSIRQALRDIGVIYYEGLVSIPAADIQPGDILVRPCSSHMCWRVVDNPTLAANSVLVEQSEEYRHSGPPKSVKNRRNFKFRYDETVRVMRLDT